MTVDRGQAGRERACMLNSAACSSKTARAPAGLRCCQKSSRHKGLMQGRSPHGPRAFETSRYPFERHTAALSPGRRASDSGMREEPNTGMVATTLATDLSEMAYGRPPCDDQRSGSHPTLGRESEPGLEHLAPAALDTQLHPRPDGPELVACPSVAAKGHMEAAN